MNMPYIKGLTTKDLRRHVVDLCDKHGVTVYAWCCRVSQCHALTDRDEGDVCHHLRCQPKLIAA